MANKPARNVFFNRPGKCFLQFINSLSSIYVGGFIPGVKMYAYANGHAPGRKMVPSMYFQMLQAIVIQHPVIDPPTGSALTVNGFVLPRISRNAGMEAQAGMVFNVDSTPITAGRTFRFIWAGTDASAFEGAAVFMCIFHRTVSPRAHFMPGPADRMPFFIESDVVRGISRRLCPPIDINKGIDIPAFQQFISWNVVMRRVKAYIFRWNTKSITPKIIYGIKGVFTAMPACTGKLHQKGEFDFECIVPGAEHVKGMPEVPCFVIAVPAPFSIGVGIMAGTAGAVRAGTAAGRKMPAERGRMGNHSGAVPGEGKVLRANQPKAGRRQYGKDGKDYLE